MSKSDEWTVLSMLEWATDYFKQKNIPDPRHSIEWLLAETLNVKRLDLYLKYDRPLSPAELDKLRPLVKRRAQHEPLQYIVGYSEFMNARLTVTPDVLIPRIETEQLCEIILSNHSNDDKLSVLDIGTGSGCIPIALKMERPQWQVSGVDVSTNALEIAGKNADANQTEISLVQEDILADNPLPGSGAFDIIVSNPPYIKTEEKAELEPQVAEFEPHEALFFDDEQSMYGSIIKFAEEHLSLNGNLYLELHHLYTQPVLDIFNESKWQATVLQDYNKKPRFIVAHRK